MDLRAIENSIAALPRELLASFDKWYAEFIAQKWDEQFAEDSKNGRLDKIAENAEKNFTAGKHEEI